MRVRALLLACAALGSVCGPVANAQDRAAPPSLEDLIPDSAIDDPEGWAVKFDGDVVNGEAAPTLDADAPLAEMPDISVPWPDDGEIPRSAALEPDPDIVVAGADFEAMEPLPEGIKERLSSELLLVFPEDRDDFPEREAFADRFEALSNVDSLSNGKDNIAVLAARARQDEVLLERLLRNYGYYDGQVFRSVSGREEDDEEGRSQVRFDILPGVQYRFGVIDLSDLPTAPDYEELRKSFEIWPGDPLLADRIVEEGYDLDKALGETGYPFAAIGEPELLVDHDRQEGDLRIPVKNGGKYRFGSVVSKMPKFLSSHHLQEIARFKPGDTYKRSDELDLRRAIIATGLVSSVTITPRDIQAPAGGEPGVVDMDVDLTKAKLRTISGAIGYGTGEGFRVEAGWEHRNFFPPEGALRLRGIAGTKEQLVGVTFRRNNFHGRDRILTVDAYANTVDRQAYDARTTSLLVTYERVSTLLFQKPFTWSVGAELVATDENAATVNGIEGDSQTYLIAALPVSAGIDTSDDLLDPTKGFRVGARVSPEISVLSGNKATYLRSQVDLSGYVPIGGKVVLAGRARLGSIIGTQTDNIALSRRLYAGGGGSVRGYGYQDVSPKNADGDPTGGRSLAEFSLEARVDTGMFGGALQIVPFIDAGAVDRGVTPNLSGLRFGAGIGVRYKTGFGPIRVDIATPLNREPGDARVAVYVGLGQAF